MKRMLLALILPTLLLTACGSSPEDQMVDSMEEMADIISGVEDLDGAKAAGEKIKALAESMEDVAKELEKKYEGKEMVEVLDEDQQKRLKEATAKITKTMMKFVTNRDVAAELTKAMAHMRGLGK